SHRDRYTFVSTWPRMVLKRKSPRGSPTRRRQSTNLACELEGSLPAQRAPRKIESPNLPLRVRQFAFHARRPAAAARRQRDETPYSGLSARREASLPDKGCKGRCRNRHRRPSDVSLLGLQ